MEFLLSTKLSLSLIQVVLLLSLSAIFLLFRRIKLTLMTNCLFTLYWGYLLHRDLLFRALDTSINPNLFDADIHGMSYLKAILATALFVLMESIITLTTTLADFVISCVVKLSKLHDPGY